MHLCAGLRRKYGQRRARKSEMLASSFLFTSLDWTLRSSVNDALLNSVSWNSRKAGSIPRSSSSPVQPAGGKGSRGLEKEARHATNDVTRLQIYLGHRRCSCPWWQHHEGQREEKQPLCGSAGLGHSEAMRASSVDGPTTSWLRRLSNKHINIIQKDSNYNPKKKKINKWRILRPTSR